MALFLDPATMASVWQFGPSGPMKAAISLNYHQENLLDMKLGSGRSPEVPANQVHRSLRGDVLQAPGVFIGELQLDVRQQARAVVDLLDSVGQRSRNGSTLSFKSIKTPLNLNAV